MIFFAQGNPSGACSLGQTSREQSEWISISAVRVRAMGDGLRASAMAVITAGSHLATMSSLFSYAAPAIRRSESKVDLGVRTGPGGSLRMDEVSAFVEGRCSRANTNGSGCESFTEWSISDHPSTASSPQMSVWYFCSDVNALADCSDLVLALPDHPQLVASAARQAGDIYESYGNPEVEGTSLVYTASASYSTGTGSWWDYTLEVLLVNFGDGWIGVTFRYIDDDNYYRFEMNAQKRIRRLKRRSSGDLSRQERRHRVRPHRSQLCWPCRIARGSRLLRWARV